VYQKQSTKQNLKQESKEEKLNCKEHASLFYKEKAQWRHLEIVKRPFPIWCLKMVAMAASHVMIILFHCHLQFGSRGSSGATGTGGN
jgi:hypothetical protein